MGVAAGVAVAAEVVVEDAGVWLNAVEAVVENELDPDDLELMDLFLGQVEAGRKFVQTPLMEASGVAACVRRRHR